MKKKLLGGTAVSTVVIIVLLSTLIIQGPSYAALAPENKASPSPAAIPGVIITGDYIRIGVNYGGTFGVGDTATTGTGFQYPIGSAFESLAYAWWGEGYVFAYKTWDGTKWVDRIAYWQPSYGWPIPAACRIVYESFVRTVYDSNFAHYTSTVRTSDGYLRVKFHFMFPRHMKYVTLLTEIYTHGTVKDLIYKRFVDWDIHCQTADDWTSDSQAVYASYYNAERKVRYCFTTSGDTVSNWHKYEPYAELDGWDDRTVRRPGSTIQSQQKPIRFDGAGMITFDLGNGMPRSGGLTLSPICLYYQAGQNSLGPY